MAAKAWGTVLVGTTTILKSSLALAAASAAMPDVAVVGKHDDALGVGHGGGVEDVGRGGVHRLATGNHDVHAERLQDLRLAVTGRHGHEPELLARLGGLGGSGLVRGDASRAVMGLHVHVVDEDLIDLAVLEHVLEHAGWARWSERGP